jgi:hypothetical protein
VPPSRSTSTTAPRDAEITVSVAQDLVLCECVGGRVCVCMCVCVCVRVCMCVLICCVVVSLVCHCHVRGRDGLLYLERAVPLSLPLTLPTLPQ